MSKIKVYARARPSQVPCERLRLYQDRVEIALGQKGAAKYSGAHYREYGFRFDGVFDESADQECVFQEVATRIVDQFLDGYNGTIFAYGQTASGKTYTMEGSARKYSERGLVARILSRVYARLEERKDEEEFTVRVSFMEIYQDVGYDLLNPANSNDAFTITLPRVYVSDGSNGEVMVRNLSVHLAGTEELALNFFFQGCMCRKMAETTMNAHSSRSHVVFTITLTSQKPDSEILVRSKLHLVDLAGSERVARTGSDGRVLEEAKAINLTLHHLEHVIVKLQKQSLRNNALGNGTFRISSAQTTSRDRAGSTSSRNGTTDSGTQCSKSTSCCTGTFVPYRNSVLTMLLKDSLGGNCFTAMIATFSIEEQNIRETLSTCQFAQRVACISNKTRRNEELDDKVVICKLKQRVAELEQKLRSYEQTSEKEYTNSETTSLNEADRRVCHQVLLRFLHKETDNPLLEGINDSSKVLECFLLLRDTVLHTLHSKNPSKAFVSKPRTCWEEESSDQSKCQPDKEGAQKGLTSHRHHHHHHHQSLCTTSSSLKPSLHDPMSIQSPFSMVSSSGFVSLMDEEDLEIETPSSSSSHSMTKVPNSCHQQERQWREHLRSTEEKKSTLADKQGKTMSCHPVSTLSHKTTGDYVERTQGIPSSIPPQVIMSNHPAPTTPHKKSPDGGKLIQEDVDISKFELQEKRLRKESQELSHQLATQHEKVVCWKSKQSSEDMEQLIMERMVEQQIKLKLAKVNSNLLELQYQIKRQKISQNSEKLKQQPDKLPSFQTTLENVRLPDHHPPQRLTGDSPSSRSKEEAKELNLLIAEADKQLELKEAATRKRLQAIKQLMKSETSSPALQLDSKTVVKRENKFFTSLEKELKTSNELQERQTISAPQTLESNDHSVTLTKVSPQPHKVHFEAHQPEHSPTKAWQKPTSPTIAMSVVEPVLSTPLLSHPVRMQPQAVSHEITSSKRESLVRRFGSESDSNGHDLMRRGSNRVRLCITDDDLRETNYINVARSHRSRALRVRRCIAAATLIQRAWRKYKQRT